MKSPEVFIYPNGIKIRCKKGQMKDVMEVLKGSMPE